MNKRQAKKNFKKKYGCNPNKFAEIYCTNLQRSLQELQPAIENAMKVICDCITHFSEYLQSEEFKKRMEVIAHAVEQAEEIQEHEN